ncbi:lipopolysaccharide assembly protein LapA domain-containing protein [Pseudovibrio flavus]|uniref:lipopolysaccharide assembly protein LapA domain-containing protein n=1 Tax=Pseudovibrio flavus TaxID=2529854 RepID=UPI00211B7CD9|nr:lipopolysaccharide assembly protein LapA domain-containing protein [Pseudovibrio flavus]
MVPLGAVLLVLAVANRHSVPVSLNPFNPADPGLTFNIPVFWLLFGAVAVGVVLGGVMAWTKQGKYRKAARSNRAKAAQLQHEADELRTAAASAKAHNALPKPDTKWAA